MGDISYIGGAAPLSDTQERIVTACERALDLAKAGQLRAAAIALVEVDSSVRVLGDWEAGAHFATLGAIEALKFDILKKMT